MNTLRLSIGTARHSQVTAVPLCSCQYIKTVLRNRTTLTGHRCTTVQLSIYEDCLEEPHDTHRSPLYHCVAVNTLRLSWGTARHSQVTAVPLCSCQSPLYSDVHKPLPEFQCQIYSPAQFTVSSADCSRQIIESCLLFVYVTNCVDRQIADRRCKGKAIPVQAGTGLEGSRMLKLPDFKKIITRRR